MTFSCSFRKVSKLISSSLQNNLSSHVLLPIMLVTVIVDGVKVKVLCWQNGCDILLFSALLLYPPLALHFSAVRFFQQSSCLVLILVFVLQRSNFDA